VNLTVIEGAEVILAVVLLFVSIGKWWGGALDGWEVLGFFTLCEVICHLLAAGVGFGVWLIYQGTHP